MEKLKEKELKKEGCQEETLEPETELPQEEAESAQTNGDGEEKEESWEEYYIRRMQETGKSVLPDVGWYLSQQIFKERIDDASKIMEYEPAAFVLPLPCPILNVWTLKDEQHRLSDTLDLCARDIDRVVYYSAYLVLSGTDGLRPGDAIGEKEYHAAKNKPGFEACMGAEALVKYADMKGKTANGIIRDFPVIYPYGKPGHLKDRRLLSDFFDDFCCQYVRIANRIDRIRKLEEIGAPEIIMRNEKRILQEMSDALIHNGLRGMERTGRYDVPLFSFYDMVEG